MAAKAVDGIARGAADGEAAGTMFNLENELQSIDVEGTHLTHHALRARIDAPRASPPRRPRDARMAPATPVVVSRVRGTDDASPSPRSRATMRAAPRGFGRVRRARPQGTPRAAYQGFQEDARHDPARVPGAARRGRAREPRGDAPARRGAGATFPTPRGAAGCRLVARDEICGDERGDVSETGAGRDRRGGRRWTPRAASAGVATIFNPYGMDDAPAVHAGGPRRRRDIAAGRVTPGGARRPWHGSAVRGGEVLYSINGSPLGALAVEDGDFDRLEQNDANGAPSSCRSGCDDVAQETAGGGG